MNGGEESQATQGSSGHSSDLVTFFRDERTVCSTRERRTSDLAERRRLRRRRREHEGRRRTRGGHRAHGLADEEGGAPRAPAEARSSSARRARGAGGRSRGAGARGGCAARARDRRGEPTSTSVVNCGRGSGRRRVPLRLVCGSAERERLRHCGDAGGDDVGGATLTIRPAPGGARRRALGDVRRGLRGEGAPVRLHGSEGLRQAWPNARATSESGSSQPG